MAANTRGGLSGGAGVCLPTCCQCVIDSAVVLAVATIKY
jgi:hypothetical protein